MYRYFDIGSGKPSPEERSLVRHYLIDVVDPDYPFTAGDFCEHALLAAGEIRERGKIPLFVGGTGLYIDSFFKGLSDIPRPPASVRDVLLRELEEKGLDALYQELHENDEQFARTIHPHDRQRILRGLEVLRGTGRPISDYYRGTRGEESESTLFIGLHEDRNVLRQLIGARVDAMLAGGFVEEVRELRRRGYGPGLKSMKSIGYREINRHLDGLESADEMVGKIKINTARYAKRQMTWFTRNSRMRWFSPGQIDALRELVERWIDETEP